MKNSCWCFRRPRASLGRGAVFAGLTLAGGRSALFLDGVIESQETANESWDSAGNYGEGSVRW